MGVGVMRDYKLKLRDLHTTHALGCVGDGHETRLRGERFESVMGECMI